MTSKPPEHGHGREARTVENLYPGGALPYGFRLSDLGEWEQVPAEVEIIREMHALWARGISYRAIANRLNARGVPTPKGGEKWSASTVTRILRNPRYYRDPKQPPPTLKSDPFAAIRYARAAQVTGILGQDQDTPPEPDGAST